jgi:hypothetical protein
VPFEVACVPLPDGAVTVLYTDGLVESRARDVDTGLTALREALVAAPPDLEQMCDAVLTAMGTGEGTRTMSRCWSAGSPGSPRRTRLLERAVRPVGRLPLAGAGCRHAPVLGLDRLSDTRCSWSASSSPTRSGTPATPCGSS